MTNKQIDLKYTELMDTFVPQYANADHIQIVRYLKQINILNHDITQRLRDKESIKEASVELRRLKIQVIYFISKPSGAERP